MFVCPDLFSGAGRRSGWLAVLVAAWIVVVTPASRAACGLQDPGADSSGKKQETGSETKPGDLFKKIAEMVASGDVREAVAEVDRFEQANADRSFSEDIHKSRQLLYQAFGRMSSFRDAWDELKKLVDYELADLSDQISLGSATGTIAAMIPLAQQTGRNVETFALIDSAETKYKALAEANPAGVAAQQLVQLRLIKGSSLIQMNEYDKGMGVFREEVARLRELRVSHPEDKDVSRVYFQALAQLGIHSKDLAERDPALAEYQSFVTESMKEDAKNPEWLRMYVAVISARIDARLVRPEREGEPVKVIEPEVIEQLFAEGMDVVSGFTASDPQVSQLTAALKAALMQLEIVFKGNAKIPELIGKPVAEPPVVAWVNGTDPGDEGRKGKVVLLNLWSGGLPITSAIIDYNKQLLEKFPGGDLMVLGVTQHYNLRWNEASASLLQARSKVPEAEEEEALEKFLANRGASWPVMIVGPGLSLLDSFGASLLPHFVLVDKNGNIQMIRGAFNENVKSDLETKIAELLKE